MEGTFKERLHEKYRMQVRTAQIVLFVVASFTAVFLGISFDRTEFVLPALSKIIMSLPTVILFAMAFWSLSNPISGFLVGFIFLVLLTILAVMGFSIISILLYGAGANMVWKGRVAAKELIQIEGEQDREDILDSNMF